MDKIMRGPSGHRCGESHHRAKLSDDDVRKMRSMYKPYVRGIEFLAKHFNCGISTARDVVTYRTRINVK